MGELVNCVPCRQSMWGQRASTVVVVEHGEQAACEGAECAREMLFCWVAHATMQRPKWVCCLDERGGRAGMVNVPGLLARGGRMCVVLCVRGGAQEGGQLGDVDGGTRERREHVGDDALEIGVDVLGALWEREESERGAKKVMRVGSSQTSSLQRELKLVPKSVTFWL